MAYNTTAIKKDVDGKPIPQYYNDLQDAYEALKGRNGANRVELYDASGNPVDLETLLTAIATKLDDVTITASALPTGAATSTKQDTIKAAIDDLIELVQSMKDMEYYGASLSDRPAANAVPVGAIFMVVGNFDIIYQSNGTEWVVVT